MRIVSYSDLHLEFAKNREHCAGASPGLLAAHADPGADVAVLAGDVVTLDDPTPLGGLLAGWDRPVMLVAGNHEHYTRRPMDEDERALREWLAANHPNVTFLRDGAATVGGTHFFGGTMWTDYAGSDPRAMAAAHARLVDYRHIVAPGGARLTPPDTVRFHEAFARRLREWFALDLRGPRVVVTHTAPAENPDSSHAGSPLVPAFVSTDMVETIRRHRPALWVHGHTHECVDMRVGETRVVSNQLGYPLGDGRFECAGFDPAGVPVDV